jgi:hypothetical protein
MFFPKFGFKHCESNHNIYVLNVNDIALIISLYVDDLVITRGSDYLILGFKKQFIDTYEMTNLDLLHFCLVIQILHMDDNIFIS